MAQPAKFIVGVALTVTIAVATGVRLLSPTRAVDAREQGERAAMLEFATVAATIQFRWIRRCRAVSV